MNSWREVYQTKDNIDGTITNDIQFLDENERIDTNVVGMYEYRYRVTNSNQRTTTKSSTIIVYDKPTIKQMIKQQ